MNTAERRIEDLARAVVCPVCNAQTDIPCRDIWLPRSVWQMYAHQARLELAKRLR